MPIIVSENLTKLRFRVVKYRQSHRFETRRIIAEKYQALRGISMSLTTVSRLLAKFSLSFYVAKIKPKLTEKHKLESLNFARMNLKQPIEYWRTFQYTMSIAQNAMQIERQSAQNTQDEWNPKYFLEVQNMDCFRA
ncbi:Transposase [Hexamita inflata]|uniref:Tc1-like n=1 Tax=Hexamita inflata TaxID=28002 RepID=A0AA86QTL9_9EUKA|nr:Tc1-like [Hexamita inflata]